MVTIAPTTEGDPVERLIEIRAARSSYGVHAVLRGVDLVVSRGEIVGLIGINGAGKSTLVGALTGQRRLDEGSMVLADEPYAPGSVAEAQACGIGVISQNSEPPVELTVAEALFRNTYRAGEPHAQLRERAQQLLDEAGVELDPDVTVAALDRAKRALVDVVRMLAEEAQLVIIDEVAVTLADHEIAVLHHVLRRLAAQGRGILYITHRMDEVQSIVNRIVVLRGGVIVIDRSVSGLTADEIANLLLGEPLVPLSARSRDEGSSGPPAIAVLDVTVGDALLGVDLVVRPGEVVAVTGAYDSGARELLEVLGGVRGPDRGHLERFGARIEFASRADAERRGVSFLADAAPGATGERRLIEGIAGDDRELEEEIRRARRMIDLVQELRINTTDINSAVDELSGGDRQKAEFVRTIERGGDVLVLAHPTRGVDVGARRALFLLLYRLATEGVAVIFLGSDITELLAWSDRVVVLAKGRVALEGPSVELDEDTVVRAMLGGPLGSGSGRRAAADA